MDLTTSNRNNRNATQHDGSELYPLDLNKGANSQESKGQNGVETSDGLQWKDGVGTLPGCDELKFRKNDLGVVELITENAQKEETQNGGDSEEIDDDVDESVVEVKGETKTAARIHASHYAHASNADEENNIAVDSEISNTETCAICGVRGNKRGFVGRFCSRKCLGRNANMHRNTFYKNKQSNSHGGAVPAQPKPDLEMPSVIHGGDEGASNDLKIRIRLSSGSPVDKSDPNNVRKRKYTGQTTAGISGGARKKKFVWSQYLGEKEATIAPPDAFEALTGKNPFNFKNDFKLGMALEGVDPKHQSLICPLNVTAVKGNRVRLHFCGFSESYDFWVNADNPLIFPCGFCQNTGRHLEPPRGFTPDAFKWEKYMKKFKLYPAPESILSTKMKKNTCGFEPRDKLEAVDKINPDLICVATISDVIGDNLLIHFDGWTNDFDYWCSPSSYLIHPVGWCAKEGKDLTPPEGYEELHFSWPKYMKQTNSKAADEALFCKPRSHAFKKGMKVEVVDPRNPILVRVATIVEINGFRILIHLDGWSNVYDFWTDLESADLHPAGWCSKTNYSLQPPITPDDLTNATGQSGCPVPGCIGVGHVRGSKFVNHHSEFGCPYSLQNLNKVCLNDRLSKPRQSSSSPDFVLTQAGADKENGYEYRSSVAKQRRKRNSNAAPAPEEEQQPTPPAMSGEKMIISSNDLNTLLDDNGKSQYSALHHSVYMSAMTSFPNYDLPVCWDQHSRILPSVKGTTVTEVSKWTTNDVAKFVSDLTGRHEHGKVFLDEEIDGEAMLLLTQADISKVLNFKLGPAVKIYNAMLLIKASEHLPV